ncbi:MAG: hypothetical protein ALECFALPRED_002986 [Alectoria fallacina]|uniref:Uncharacterized protein n=1 Tax=Alectoria fallacina TaxID=1903189 RepID=A0A8H3I415_9LECA|nr:MAG: hypothetical protein ALECFALPRED_002986 [Alectoria fallacina]
MGVQIHSEDPISPTPQTADRSNAGNPSQRAKATAPSLYAYPPAQPGAAAPTATSTVPQSSSYGPPAPQAGAAPVPPPPTITPKPSLPPPPKAGEKPLSPEHYAPVHFTPAQPLPYASQMSQPTVEPPLEDIPAGSTTSTSMRASFENSSAQPSIIPSSTGYVQNPFASDMTPDQRFAAEQQQENRADILPSLGYVDNPKGPRPGFEDEGTVWGAAKKWVKETGGKAREEVVEVWDKLGRER